MFQGKLRKCCVANGLSSGLGLTTVSHIVKSMGGNISVESVLGEGSTFTVNIPVKTFPDIVATSLLSSAHDSRTKLQIQTQQNYISLLSTASERSDDNQNGTAEPSTLEVKNQQHLMDKAEIIVAEDNPINRKVIINLINNNGFKADFATDGKELVEQFDVDRHKVVITDMVCNIESV